VRVLRSRRARDTVPAEQHRLAFFEELANFRFRKWWR
jgi:hypothetical protein